MKKKMGLEISSIEHLKNSQWINTDVNSNKNKICIKISQRLSIGLVKNFLNFRIPPVVDYNGLVSFLENVMRANSIQSNII
jgi:hypothetical protein